MPNLLQFLYKVVNNNKNRYLKIRFKIEFNCAIKINENKNGQDAIIASKLINIE